MSLLLAGLLQHSARAQGSECSQNLCTNGGSCIAYNLLGRSREECACPDGFSGDRCEVWVCGMQSIDKMLRSCCVSAAPGGTAGGNAERHRLRLLQDNGTERVHGCDQFPGTCSPECAALFEPIHAACRDLLQHASHGDADRWAEFSSHCEGEQRAASNALLSQGVDPAAAAECRAEYEVFAAADRRPTNGGCGCGKPLPLPCVSTAFVG